MRAAACRRLRTHAKGDAHLPIAGHPVDLVQDDDLEEAACGGGGRVALRNLLDDFLRNVTVPVGPDVGGIKLNVVVAAEKGDLHLGRLEFEGPHVYLELFDARAVDLRRARAV